MLSALPVAPLVFQVDGGGTAHFTALRGEVVAAAPALKALGLWPGGALEPSVRFLERRGLHVHRVAPGGALAPWRGDTQAVRITAPFDVYIGRVGNGQDHRPESGWYGKPGGKGKPCGTCPGPGPGTCLGRDQILDCYDRWLRLKVVQDRGFRDLVAALYGLQLGCFCRGGTANSGQGRRCHGDSLAAVAEELAGPPQEDILRGILSKL